MSDALDYHLRELDVARDQTNRNRIMPTVEPRHRTILDVGCGMGQTLIGLDLPPGVQAYGVDPDESAIAAGNQLGLPNIHLSVGGGEHLPFPDSFFDLAISRVAIPYMHITPALQEIARVLKPGGDLWLVLHPRTMYTRRALQSLQKGRIKDVVYCGYVLLNGLLFHLNGSQLTLGGRTESFQSAAGMTRALTRAGFTDIRLQNTPFFLIEGRKLP